MRNPKNSARQSPLVLVDPTDERLPNVFSLANRLASLSDTTVAAVNALNDPKRCHGTTLIQRIIDILKAQGAKNVLSIRKHPSSLDMKEELQNKIVEHAQAVVILEGD